jgi:hypothetical protein
MKTSIVLLLVLLACIWNMAQGKDQPDKEVTAGQGSRTFNSWMQEKLENSQAIFAAMAVADFEMIEESSERLSTVGSLEGFVRKGYPGYRTQLSTFQFAVNDIREQAAKKNIEGVALGFHQLTLSCVNCHKQLRNVSADAR